MHKLRFSTRWTLLSLFMLSTSTFASGIPTIQHWKVGITPVYFIQTQDLPMLDLRIIFDAGSARDGEHPGLANLTSAMIGAGTKEYSEAGLAEGFDTLGAVFSQTTQRDLAVFSLRTRTEPSLLKQALSLFANALMHPNFPTAAFQRQQQQSLRAIMAEQQAPDRVASRAFFQSVYGQHPYAHATLGNSRSVSAIKLSDLRNFYREHYTRNAAKIIMVGNISTTHAQAIAQTLMHDLPQGHKLSALAAPRQLLLSPQTQHIRFPSQQTTILMGQVGINGKDPSLFPLMVGNEILGSSGGLSSRLFMDVREKKGLAYSVYSAFYPFREKGPFFIILQTRSQQASEALRITRQTLLRFIQHPVSEKELIFAKKYLVGSFPLELSSNSGLLEHLTLIAFHDFPIDYLQTYSSKIQAVSAQQIRTAFQQRIHPELFSTVRVGSQ